MDLPAFVPKDLRQLARFVPARGWDAIAWRPLLASLRDVSVSYATGRGVSALREACASEVPGLRFTHHVPRPRRLEALTDPVRRRRAGDELLRLYFAQWRVDEGLFLDLRAGQLGLDDDDRLLFAPNGLWIRLRPEFRQGMIDLYRSFYTDDGEAFRAALRRMGLAAPGMAPEAEAQLEAKLRAHFGLDQSAQRFSIDRFQASFDDLFAFFVDHGYTLHIDFVFVGFYLITLYLTLDELGEAHDVRAICREVLAS